ncbi:MAG: hypothetical protein ABIQ99_13610 [Thermoflexales bacterium]
MRLWIGAGFGVALLGMGALIPFIVPTRDQIEVMVIALFFEVTGAMLIWSALNGPGTSRAEPRTIRDRAGWWVLGMVLAMAGLGLPLAQRTVSADGRFLWMTTFAPMALIGVALVWREVPEPWKDRLRGADDDAAPPVRKKPVARLGAGKFARRVLPVGLVILAAALLAAMLIALIATVLIAGLAL